MSLKNTFWDISPKGGSGFWQNPKFSLITNLGHYLMGWGAGSKVNMPKFDLFLVLFSPFILEVLAI